MTNFMKFAGSFRAQAKSQRFTFIDQMFVQYGILSPFCLVSSMQVHRCQHPPIAHFAP